jgi:hypothetical protein
MARPEIDDDALLGAVTRLVIRDGVDHQEAVRRVGRDIPLLVRLGVPPPRPLSRAARQRLNEKFRAASCTTPEELRLLALDPRLPGLVRARPDVMTDLTEPVLGWLEGMADRHQASVKGYVNNLMNIYPTEN